LELETYLTTRSRKETRISLVKITSTVMLSSCLDRKLEVSGNQNQEPSILAYISNERERKQPAYHMNVRKQKHCNKYLPYNCKEIERKQPT
jgi:hypothetical protein